VKRTLFFTPKNARMANDLAKYLVEACQVVPRELEQLRGGGGGYGFGGPRGGGGGGRGRY